ncbi:hypothetical protein ACH5RR_009121 [Cinchona calisaya]|uniref:Uncharacterized protein n=1 Tax=Cinchona calisaya TaxID=153742 RepID=A0ABD3ADH5_9GENT
MMTTMTEFMMMMKKWKGKTLMGFKKLKKRLIFLCFATRVLPVSGAATDMDSSAMDGIEGVGPHGLYIPGSEIASEYLSLLLRKHYLLATLSTREINGSCFCEASDP